jgi:hypothetical protein
MRPAVLHLGDPRVRVRRALPVLVGDLLVLPLFVEPANLLVRWLGVRLDDALFLHEAHNVAAPVVAGVLTDDALHRGIGFESRRVDADRLALQQALLVGQLQYEPEGFGMNFQRQSVADPGETRMVRSILRERHAQELPQTEAVVAPPGDPPLAADPLEVAHQQHPKVDPRRNRRPARRAAGLVVRCAQRLHEPVEARFGQQLVELPVKGVTLRPRQTVMRHEQLGLPLVLSSS